VKRAHKLFRKQKRRDSGNVGMCRCNELGTTHMKLHQVAGDSRFVSPNRGETIGRLSFGCVNCVCI